MQLTVLILLYLPTKLIMSYPRGLYTAMVMMKWLMYVSVQSRFDWDEKQQGLILASFFWFFWVSQVPGGLLAQRYGTKLVYGLANGVSCLMSFFIPVCARLDYRVLVFLRALQGFINVSTIS